MSEMDAPGSKRAQASSCFHSGDSMTTWLVIWRVGTNSKTGATVFTAADSVACSAAECRAEASAGGVVPTSL